jgi:nuclear GTP-binding protein
MIVSKPTLSSIAQLAESAPANDIPSTPPDSMSVANKTREQQRRHFIHMLHKVVDEADVMLIVLDARDPAQAGWPTGRGRGTQMRSGGPSRFCYSTKLVREPHPFFSSSSSGRSSIFDPYRNVDLVPRENAQAGLKHLRRTTPTLPFRSAGPHQRTNLAPGMAPALLHLLKAYKPSAAQSVTIGVVGFPNQRRQKHSDQHAQTGQGASSCFSALSSFFHF